MRDATSVVGNITEEEACMFNELCRVAILVPVYVEKEI
jgi:hypothetical protein